MASAPDGVLSVGGDVTCRWADGQPYRCRIIERRPARAHLKAPSGAKGVAAWEYYGVRSSEARHKVSQYACSGSARCRSLLAPALEVPGPDAPPTCRGDLTRCYVLLLRSALPRDEPAARRMGHARPLCVSTRRSIRRGRRRLRIALQPVRVVGRAAAACARAEDAQGEAANRRARGRVRLGGAARPNGRARARGGHKGGRSAARRHGQSPSNAHHPPPTTH